MNEIEELKWKLECALHDIQAYRGALGYAVPGDHNGKLMDGTTPQCGMCNSEYRKNLEAKCAQMRAALELCTECTFLRESTYEKARHALSGDCGRGWIPVTELEPTLNWFNLFLGGYEPEIAALRKMHPGRSAGEVCACDVVNAFDEFARLKSLMKGVK